jgi:spermidine synthase
MACKDAPVTFLREEAAERKPFETLYYNAAIQRAAGACPEFFRKKLYG